MIYIFSKYLRTNLKSTLYEQIIFCNPINCTFLVVAQVNLSSCSKSSSGTITPAAQSTMALLTGKQWFFDTIYTAYSNGSGTLSYARGSNSNTLNLDDARYVYWADGTEDAFDADGSTDWYSETWQFTNNSDSTELYYPPAGSRSYPVYQRILKLSATDLIIYDSTDHGYFHQVARP